MQSIPQEVSADIYGAVGQHIASVFDDESLYLDGPDQHSTSGSRTSRSYIGANGPFNRRTREGCAHQMARAMPERYLQAVVFYLL